MTAQRLCRRCHARLGIDDDVCQACGMNNPVPVPWHAPLLGAAVVIVLVYLLVDFDDVARVLGF